VGNGGVAFCLTSLVDGSWKHLHRWQNCFSTPSISIRIVYVRGSTGHCIEAPPYRAGGDTAYQNQYCFQDFLLSLALNAANGRNRKDLLDVGSVVRPSAKKPVLPEFDLHKFPFLEKVQSGRRGSNPWSLGYEPGKDAAPPFPKKTKGNGLSAIPYLFVSLDLVRMTSV
jgi:hypothetical protein